jgi:hypothetical protein
MLTVQVLWACHAWNTTPEEAAQQIVADLFDQLARGGSVSVHVEGLSGKEYTLEVTARRRPESRARRLANTPFVVIAIPTCERSSVLMG